MYWEGQVGSGQVSRRQRYGMLMANKVSRCFVVHTGLRKTFACSTEVLAEQRKKKDLSEANGSKPADYFSAVS